MLSRRARKHDSRAGRRPQSGRDHPAGQAVLERGVRGDLLHQDHRNLADRLARARKPPMHRHPSPDPRRRQRQRRAGGLRRGCRTRNEPPRERHLRGEPVLEDTISLRSSLVERSLPLLRRGDAPDTPHLSDWPDAALWSPEQPNLYDLRLELLDGRRGARRASRATSGCAR